MFKKIIFISLLILFTSTGCSIFNNSNGNTGTSIEDVELEDNIVEGKIQLHFGAGNLSFTGNSNKLMEGTFTSNNDDLMPKIKYNEKNNKANLSIKPKKSGLKIRGNIRNDWELAFSDKVPLSFSLKLGAGRNILNFDYLIIKDLSVNAGVGETVIDLSGVESRDFIVEVNSGVGSTKLIFSKDDAVVVNISKGIGSVFAKDFYVDGDYYKTTVDSDEFINVTVKQGIGEIILETK